MAVAIGVAISSYERNRRRVALARHHQDLEAGVEVAHVAGQNEVATGADTVVDLLSRTTPLLSTAAGPVTVGRILADWRQSLAVSTAEHATYLGIALAKWQRRQNESQHDLAADITFEIKDGHGVVLLSGEQAAWLEAALDELDLRGTVNVSAVDIIEARQPNQPRRLWIGNHTLDVPPDLRPGLVPFDVGPLGFLASSMWFADTLLPGGCDPSAWAVGPGAAAGPLMALWAHRQVARRGEEAHARVLFAALAHALVHSAAATGTMKRARNSEGIQRYPFLGGINMLAMMTPLYWGDLDSGQRVLAIIGLGAIVVVGLLLMPEPIQWSHLAAELLWPAAAFYSVATMRSQLESETTRLSDELEESDMATMANAFAEGRSYVLGLVSETRYAARRSFVAVRNELDERIADEVARRLDEVDKRLEELSCANVS
jgi:hypothetical protein